MTEQRVLEAVVNVPSEEVDEDEPLVSAKQFELPQSVIEKLVTTSREGLGSGEVC